MFLLRKVLFCVCAVTPFSSSPSYHLFPPTQLGMGSGFSPPPPMPSLLALVAFLSLPFLSILSAQCLKELSLAPHTPFASDKDFLDLSHISILSLSPPPCAPAVQPPAASGISYLISAPVRLHTWEAPLPHFLLADFC